MNRSIVALVLVAGVATPATAKVVSAVSHGFEVTETVAIAAPPATVYAALIRIDRWWNGGHTYSGDAANLSIDVRPGGCWCERMKGGGVVEHMRVVHVQPDVMLRVQGGLGPLQAEGVTGALTWSIKPVAGGSELTQSYVVGGYVRGGAERLAPLVDGVLVEQLRRLALFAAQ